MREQRKMIKIKMPQAQLAQVLAFADDMLTVVESGFDDMPEEQAMLAKRIRHSLNKIMVQYNEQAEIDGN